MHVLFASHRYAPVVGGSEQHVQLLAEGLVRRGHAATVVTQGESGLPTLEERNGVTVRRIGLREVDGVRVPERYLRTLRSIPADLLHVHGNRIWCADFYFPWARVFAWPQVLTGHGFYQWEVGRRMRDRVYFRRYLPWVVRGFDRYLSNTSHERELLLEWGVPAEKIAMIPHAIAVDEFALPPADVEAFRSSWGIQRPLVAVYAGGFFPNKRVDRLVDAVARVRGRWSLVAIGRDVPGTPFDAAACSRQARQMGVDFRVLGVLSRPDLLRAMFAADVVVLGSEYEGFGLLPLEAMAAGRPFVAFATGGIPEFAATGSGTCVRTVEEFARALTTLEEESVRRQMGARGRHAVDEYSPDLLVERCLAAYRSVIGARDRAPR